MPGVVKFLWFHICLSGVNYREGVKRQIPYEKSDLIPCPSKGFGDWGSGLCNQRAIPVGLGAKAGG